VGDRDYGPRLLVTLAQQQQQLDRNGMPPPHGATPAPLVPPLGVEPAVQPAMPAAPTRAVSWWYAPSSYGGADINDTLAVLAQHGAATSLMLYCGHAVDNEGALTLDAGSLAPCGDIDPPPSLRRPSLRLPPSFHSPPSAHHPSVHACRRCAKGCCLG